MLYWSLKRKKDFSDLVRGKDLIYNITMRNNILFVDGL